MSSHIRVADDWIKFESTRYLIVFGDSFSAVGYSSKDPDPTADEPLGIAYPGLTSCERVDETTKKVGLEPNWVGHLVRMVNRRRSSSSNTSPLLVYDYAVSGDTVSRMKISQIGKEFLPNLSPRSDRPASWSSSDTLFVTWIGINDCMWNLRLGVASPKVVFTDFFKAQERLYEVGARNFCFIDVPPLHMLPKGPKSPHAEDTCSEWNTQLKANAEKFAAQHPDATVLVVSSWEVFSRVLSDPCSAGFEDDSLDRDILFVDGVHPSSAMHAVIAKELLNFLDGVSSKVCTHQPKVPGGAKAL